MKIYHLNLAFQELKIPAMIALTPQLRFRSFSGVDGVDELPVYTIY